MAQKKYTDGSGVSEIWLNIKNYVYSQLLGKSDVGHTHSASDITSGLASVATSGSYADLSNKPTSMTPTSHTHGNITNDGKVGSTANKPLITTTNGVITTGSFGTTANTFCQGNDSRLSDARTPTAHTHSASDITSGLATVATSGSYNDLSNKPTIPTVNNATLTIQRNGATVKTFTANASTNVTADITVPTKTSDLTNDSGFITSDNTKIPLVGSNAISGSLIPATDNSIDIGSSTKNIKALYTKGITIDGKTVDTDANGNLVYDSHIVDTIEEQGTGYIRYSNGIQICYGEVINNNNLATGIARFSFPKAFNAKPSVVASPNISAKYVITCLVEGNTTWVLNTFAGWTSPIEYTGGSLSVSYVAIGKWK